MNIIISLLAIPAAILFFSGYVWILGNGSVFAFNYIFDYSYQLPFGLDRPGLALALGLIAWYFCDDAKC